jgi:DNA-binding transcriptional ArsR family regulator
MVDRKAASLSEVFGAIADPTRRAILAALMRGDASVSALAAQFPMSLNGVSKHLQVLERAGLITRSVLGREHRQRLRAAPLAPAAQWLERYRTAWEAPADTADDPALPHAAARKGRRRGLPAAVAAVPRPIVR